MKELSVIGVGFIGESLLSPPVGGLPQTGGGPASFDILRTSFLNYSTLVISGRFISSKLVVSLRTILRQKS